MKKDGKKTDDKIIDVGGSPEAGERNLANRTQEEQQHKTLALGILFVLVIGVLVFFVYKNKEYRGYRVLQTSQTDYENTASYIHFSENLMKYTADGVSYIDADGVTVWTTGINMKNPIAVSCGDFAVVADLSGNTVCVFSDEGQESMVTMPYAICDVDVAKQGVFAVVLESEKTNYINLYNKKGEIVYEMQTTIDKSGYPLDIALSDDGQKLFVSYMHVGNNTMKNNLAAYNFGEVGQNANADRLVGGYEFKDEIFPKVEFIDNETVVAFGTNSIEIYSMKEKPNQKEHLKFDENIRSIFYSEKYIGVVQDVQTENAKHKYKITAYNLHGKEQFSEPVDFDYNNIFATEKEIILTGGAHCLILRTNGTVKFDADLTGEILSVVPIGKRLEYVVVYNNETHVIRLKSKSDVVTEDEDSVSFEDGGEVPTVMDATPMDVE